MAEFKEKQTKSAEIIAKVNSGIIKIKQKDYLQESEEVLDSMETCKEQILNPDCVITYDPKQDFEYKFMDVGTLSCGSVFCLGECMIDRAIVARNQVQCLLIPRYWLFEKDQNMGNIWQK